MKKGILLLATIFASSSPAFAAITIDTAYIGDPGNANDATGYGGVSYAYHIGTYEVTNSQYTAFLNSVAATDTFGLYSTSMSGTYGGITRSGSSGSYTYSTITGRENNPVNYVSFWDAARFTNWLTTGNTETGVYNLGSVTNPTNNTITRDATAWANGGVAIASENEWYKAAYYQPFADGGDTDGYWLYPTQSNSITTADANYNNSVGNVSVVGNYSSASSYYGTYDQGGNVIEWNDAIVDTVRRGRRGGSYSDITAHLESSGRGSGDPATEIRIIGFRVSSLAPIPEPSAYAAVFGCLGLLLALIRRKMRGTL